MNTEQEILANYIEALITHISEHRISIDDDKLLEKSSSIIQSLCDLKDNIKTVGLNQVTSNIKKLGKDWEKIYSKYY